MTSRLVLGYVTLALAAICAPADTWQIDPAHTAAQFAVRHFGISTVRGSFTKVGGSVQYDPADPATGAIEVSIDAASIDTRVEKRDQDLRGPNFLDVAKYSALTFKSKRIEPAGPGKLKATGDLTIHGVTRPIVLEIEGLSQPIKDPRGNLHLGASATAKISRKEFGVSGYPGVVGDEVPITIDVELVKPAGASR